MLASTALFLEPERFERIAKAATDHNNPADPFSGLNRTRALSDAARRELADVAAQYIKQFGIPSFNLQQKGGYQAPPSGCLGLLLVASTAGLGLLLLTFLVT